MDKICCLFDGDSAVESERSWEHEIVDILIDSCGDRRILFKCKKCGGLVLYDHEEMAYFIPGEDWDNAYIEERFYPVLEEDIRVTDGETEFDWAALTARKHIAASYREDDVGEKPYRYVAAKGTDKNAHRKDYTKECPVTMTVCPLRKLVQQATNISNFVELQALDPSRDMKIELPGYDELQQIIVSYRDNSYYLELSVPMDDFDWTHPLVLAAGGLTFQEVESVLDGVLLEGKSTDEIPVIMEKMRNITSTVYGEDDE